MSEHTPLTEAECIAEVLAAHEWLQYVEYGPCSCGDLSAFTAATHRAHVAAALAPVLAAAVREAEQRALREAADAVRSRFEHGWLNTAECERVESWLRDRADRITEPVSHEAATSGEEASKA